MDGKLRQTGDVKMQPMQKILQIKREPFFVIAGSSGLYFNTGCLDLCSFKQ